MSLSEQRRVMSQRLFHVNLVVGFHVSLSCYDHVIMLYDHDNLGSKNNYNYLSTVG